MKELAQPVIFDSLPLVARSLTFRVAPESDIKGALRNLRDQFPIDCGIVGIGEPVVRGVGGNVPGLRTFAAMSGAACSVPSTQQALWCRLRGADRGVVFDFAQQIRTILGDAFVLVESVDTFT
jgi:putative iron-dependent peroxidase